jgi:hypothetical protein
MRCDFDILIQARTHSIFNKEEILQSDFCGCFYCLNIIKSIEIIEWTDEENLKAPTSLCPYCGIDSVIGDKSGLPVTDANFLKAINEHSF